MTPPPSFQSKIENRKSKILCRCLTALLILSTAGLRLCYLANDCPLDLAPDEAHYWDWSRHLDWSYYSKGPLVAYLIRAGIWLAGPVSERLTGSDMLAVRLPAVVCGSLLLVALYILTFQVLGRERQALAVVGIALSLPMVSAGSTLMTIDAPFTCCWGWALVFGHRALLRGSSWAWPATGLVVGLGILAKYTMVFWLLSAFLFLLTSPGRRRTLFQPGFWTMVTVAGLCASPILSWNAHHEWVSFRHLSGQAGLGNSFGIRWLGPLRYIGLQFLLFLGFWFIAWFLAMVAFRPWQASGGVYPRRLDRRDKPGGSQAALSVSYLWWMSAPTFFIFLLFSFTTGGGEPNWPVTAYLSGLVLTAAWLAPRLRERRVLVFALAGSCALGLTVTVLMHQSRWIHPLLAQLSGPATDERPFPLRRFDPTCRLRGWRTLAKKVDRIRAELRDKGEEPIIAATGWTLPGELAFYCDGHPTVYSLGLALGERWSQYDLWRPNPLCDPEPFGGRTFIVVGEITEPVREAFSGIEPSQRVDYRENGQPIAAWKVTICRRFQAFRSGSSKRY